MYLHVILLDKGVGYHRQLYFFFNTESHVKVNVDTD